jgi:hypothetical protein
MGRNLEEIYIQSGGHSGDPLVRWESDGIARWHELVLLGAMLQTLKDFWRQTGKRMKAEPISQRSDIAVGKLKGISFLRVLNAQS